MGGGAIFYSKAQLKNVALARDDDVDAYVLICTTRKKRGRAGPAYVYYIEQQHSGSCYELYALVLVENPFSRLSPWRN